MYLTMYFFFDINYYLQTSEHMCMYFKYDYSSISSFIRRIQKMIKILFVYLSHNTITSI